jgi:ankyrin repeat protein
LEHGAQANAKDNADRTPLILGSMFGHVGAVRVLAQHMGSQGLEERDKKGKTALHWAAFANHEDVAAVLMEQGAEATSKDADGMTALMDACSTGHLGVVRVFLQQMGGQGLEEREEGGWTALHVAAVKGRDEVATCLLEHGIQANARDDDGVMPLMLASYEGLVGVVRVLLRYVGVQGQNGLDMNGATALHYAAHEGHEEVMRVLLLSGADPHSTDSEGITPRTLAEDKGHADCVAMLEVSLRD